jgi:response regulator RpfG family c-di-GMP phosphodiesterase
MPVAFDPVLESLTGCLNLLDTSREAAYNIGRYPVAPVVARSILGPEELGMRKRRAVIFDDEDAVLAMLREFFILRDYEVLVFRVPSVVCPIQGRDVLACGPLPCADVMITDFLMPEMTGIELLRQQSLRGCTMDPRNKAVISGYLDEAKGEKIRELGFTFFEKPLELPTLEHWLSECEQRIDLSKPLISRRREERFENRREVTFRLAGSEEARTGKTVNISQSGFCLEVPVPLRREQAIAVSQEYFLNCQQASVRWVRQSGSGASYLAGLRCE